ncbi:NAD-dependent epimerase/dehydratase family protein [Nonomuraea jabiensis]|uniref:Nucleoside-diphosphate-sugar epimerase n=1 Tax=Nonomuraea jabiensis TaxID=882448 RepID=A0A7W9LBF3_9ACTN|nr:NAD(P)-dependent oxidoreductase [Nonomuraea jabiensis]MBB5777640.1 nucleoside-diphosphate-sugar epimerase [Nonomuraea jabiensis]
MTDSAPPVKPARVLVTGADGTIGRPVVQALLSAGSSVTALSAAWSGPSPADRVFTGDAADETLVRQALEDADAVVHLAAIPHPGLGTAREVFVGNTSATFTVLNVAGEVGVRRAVIASSINAFGVPFNRHDLTPAYYPLDELSPVAHDDAYSLSKWVDEQTGAWAYSRWGITVVALRFPLVRDLPELREFAARLGRNPGEQARLAREGWAYLAMADAVDAVLRGLTRPISGMHTLLLAAEDTLVEEPTDLLLDRFAPTSERRRDFPGRTAPIDTSAARRVLGWVPRHRLGDPSGPISTTFQETPA